MLQKHPDRYTDPELEAWVRRLVEETVSEGTLLDYKATIDLKSSKGKLEAAKDVSSFANEIGGTIIYGVPEDRQSDEVAVPKEPYGMELIPGLEEQLENIYVDSILPRLPEYRIKKVELTKYPGKVVYIVWTPESWLGPHMVSGYGEKRYYRRGQLRAVLMEEHEVRFRYERTQRLKSSVYEFLQSQQELFGNWYRYHLDSSGPPSFTGNYVLCPQFLEANRVEFSSEGMRQWLDGNPYDEGSGYRRAWTPCAEGAEAYAGKTPQERLDYGEVVIHSNGAITRWRQIGEKVPVDKSGRIVSEPDTNRRDIETRLVIYPFELLRLWRFVQYSSKFFQSIQYYGPLHLRFSVFTPVVAYAVPPLWLKWGDFPEDWPTLGSRSGFPISFEYWPSGAQLFDEPRQVVKAIADQLFRAFGLQEAPSLESDFWSKIWDKS